MPVARYLFYVGGALLALLVVADACLSDRPAGHAGPGASVAIRIHSDRKLPELVVLDTSQPTIAPTEIAKAEPGAPPGTDSPQTRAREAFAQLQRPDADRIQSRQSVKPEAKPQRQSKIARRRIERRIRLVARPPQYGWFGYQVW
ncbi:hypothetical protein [Bradyrhizobium sp. F1.4.3]|uniref:hypothetical protein n=1 Tax=Bradyrhizobium sp. F1.4.3 TaxID=3156356 RepID=UPI0033979A67